MIILIDILFLPFLSTLMLELIKILFKVFIPTRKYFEYVSIFTLILAPVCNLPQEYATLRLLATLIVFIILNKFLLKISFKSSFISVGIYLVTAVIADLLSGITLVYFLKLDSMNLRADPITKFLGYSILTFINYLLILFIALFKKKNNNISITNNNKNLIMLLYITLTLVFISINYYVYEKYLHSTGSLISIVNIIIILFYFVLSVFTLYNSQQLTNSTEENMQLKFYISTITKLHDDLKRFRHNYINILQGIHGYANSSDIEGLKSFLAELDQKNESIRNIDLFDLSPIKDPAIRSLLFSKLSLATDRNVKVVLEAKDCQKDFHMGVSDLCEVLGVFLDNAIEECEKLDINDRRVEIVIDGSDSSYMIVVSNTYKDKPEINKLFRKGFTTKSGADHGIGLYEIKNIINTYGNILLNTYVEHDVFVQELQIK